MNYPLKTDFTGTTVCITGAGSGIGEACARAFAQAGATIIATGRRAERLEALKASLPHSEKVQLAAFDIRDKQAVQAALSSQPIEILINNAGLALGLDPAQDASVDDWDVMVDTNIKGMLYATKAVLPGMVERNRGYIFNLGSIAGSYPYTGGHVYGASKAFLKQFSLNLRADLLGKRIRVTNIEPGMVHTGFSEVRFKGDKAKADAVYEGMTPMNAEDIAQQIFWCASLPEHVNINRLESMAQMQAFSPQAFARYAE